MAAWKVVFLSCLLALSVHGQDKEKKKTEAGGAPATAADAVATRGHFGGGFNQGGFNQGGFNQGGFGGIPGGGGFGGRPVGGGLGGRPGVGGGIGGRPVGGGFGGGLHQGGGFPHTGGYPGVVGGAFPGSFVGGFQGGAGGGFVGGGFRPGFGQPGVISGGFVQPTGFQGATVGGVSAGIGSSRCRYWCKTPEGQAYCCESSNQAPKHPVTTVIDKPGQCPPVRSVCPLRSHFGAPQTCSTHGGCVNADRCCFDRCLGEHVCKQPVYG